MNIHETTYKIAPNNSFLVSLDNVYGDEQQLNFLCANHRSQVFCSSPWTPVCACSRETCRTNFSGPGSSYKTPLHPPSVATVSSRTVPTPAPPQWKESEAQVNPAYLGPCLVLLERGLVCCYLTFASSGSFYSGENTDLCDPFLPGVFVCRQIFKTGQRNSSV